jgi:hypothetical protein
VINRYSYVVAKISLCRGGRGAQTGTDSETDVVVAVSLVSAVKQLAQLSRGAWFGAVGLQRIGAIIGRKYRYRIYSMQLQELPNIGAIAQRYSVTLYELFCCS